MKVYIRMTMMGLLAFSLLAWMAAAADVSGVWVGTQFPDHPDGVVYTLKADGNKLTGTITGAPPEGGDEQQILNGKIDGDQLTWQTSFEDDQGNATFINYNFKVTGNQMTGGWKGPYGSSPTFTLTKK